MNRIAILVGVTPPESPLVVTTSYLKMWNEFLVSVAGGAWDSATEIKFLSNPTADQLTNLVTQASECDYSIFVFAGRAELGQDRLGLPELHLSLGNAGIVSERKLKPKTERCTMFLDNPPQHPLGIENSPSSGLHANKVRILYDQSISDAEKGCVRVLSPTFGKPIPGESFAYHLITKSLKWSTQNTGILNLDEAVNYTNTQQDTLTVRYNGGRRLHDFPFVLGQR